MKLNFVKVNPVENMTVFISNEVDRNSHIEISKKLMDYSNIYAEQVGFIEKPEYTYDDSCKVRLQMMGGEFCGNATRSLGAYLVHNNHESVKKADDKYYVNIETSGLNQVLTCEVEKVNDNTYMSKVEMPLIIRKPREIILKDKYKLIRTDFSGITHFIVNSADVEDKGLLFGIVKTYIENEEYEAFGIMFYDFEKEYLEPLVYVKATDSLFWERSCASGTSAFGAALTYIKQENLVIDVKQPGGILKIETCFSEGDLKKIVLNGEVKIVAQGTVYV